ncbi:glycosyltransferase [Roseisolibacter sp. H3M3-2]|uniref:glycosyltransferase n=1 Tax=Roseisolibacter sp. H3M3-2 TaxID=3031323 RepID=UPI0023DB0D68|nr:glycosyltransferase [Roseisolibacter sp. H3M3-2]MDF1502579.1 glycosyltransferase [Roseisolibacter sp. H3M3-2]
MARIVLTCWGSHGDVDPYLALARGLAARGHAPILAAPAYFREVSDAAGVAFHPIRPSVDPTDAALVRRIMDPAKGSEVVLRELIMPAAAAMYDDLSPLADAADLLVGHPVTVATRVLAERRGLPWASVVLAPTSFFSATDAPVLPPAPWLKDAERWVPAIGGWIVRGARLATSGWDAPLQALRAREGLPPAPSPIFEGQHSPHLVLALFSRLLAEPQPDWPAHVVVAGQCLYDAPHGTALSPALEAFLAAGEPPIVFTLGSAAVMAAGDFYARSLAAARAVGRRAVLLVGRDGMAAWAGERGDDVHVAAAAPHSLLFPRAAAVAQQCGAGTLGQGLRAGRPILGVPFAHDQLDDAYRARGLGMARVLPVGRYPAARAAAELRALLDDPSYAEAAARVGAVARAEDGVGAACAAIERLLAPARPRAAASA